MSNTQADRPDCVRPGDGGEEHGQSHSSSAALSASGSGGPIDETAAAASALARPSDADPSARMQPRTEQTPLLPPPSPLLSRPLDRLAKVELQLVLQFLDTKSRLKAARCSRTLLQTADDPFAWQSPTVSVNSRDQPRLGTLISQSLLRNAPISLTLKSDLSAAQVMAMPRLRRLVVLTASAADRALQALTLPSLQGLRTLLVSCPLPLTTLRLLPTLPALRMFKCEEPYGVADCSWLSAMPALTDLELISRMKVFPQALLDAVGQCALLRSLRLRSSIFQPGDFSRLCATPPLRRLRSLQLVGVVQGGSDESVSEEYRAAFSALGQLQSLRLEKVDSVDLLLAHLAQAPALRTLTVLCSVFAPLHGEDADAQPSCLALSQLLGAAPRLELRFLVSDDVDEWGNCVGSSAAYADSVGQLWRERRRMVAEMERVTIVKQ